MSQSTFIAGALLAGFVLFLAANNRLATYTAVLWGATAAPEPSGSSGSSSSSSTGDTASALAEFGLQALGDLAMAGA